MAKIIYRKGCEGRNDINSIEGIEIRMAEGWNLLVYPKYENVEIMPEVKAEWFVDAWKSRARDLEGAGAVRVGTLTTSRLLEAGSPAAGFIRKFGDYHFPPLAGAVAMMEQRDAINALAKTIKGADMLEDTPVWTSVRATETDVWAYGTYAGEDEARATEECVTLEWRAVPTRTYRVK